MAVLGHPAIREHKHIVRLEGICWDIPSDDEVRPILVFQKTHLGDLQRFVKLERFKNLSIKDRLNLCADIGIAIRDMHHIGIIHGDIKPQNVLMFEEDSRVVARMADFGFATCSQGDYDRILLPKSEPWNAPEHHNSDVLPMQAKQMDIYSFGMLCFWLLFEAGSPSNLPLPSNMTQEISQYISFERNEPERNLLQLWRKDYRLVDWICWLVRENSHLENSVKDRLIPFFWFTLTPEPQSRCANFRELFDLLIPERDLPELQSVQITSPPGQEDFEISYSTSELYNADFRLREFIVTRLRFLLNQSARSRSSYISPTKAALQLALSYTIGFGIRKDDDQATILLSEYSLEHADIRSRIEIIENNAVMPSSEGGLFPKLEREGHIQYIDFPDHYRERGLLERAENAYKQEIQSIKQTFGENHDLYGILIARLAYLISDQRRWKEAEDLELQVLEISKETLGVEHRDTLMSMGNLAEIYKGQERWEEAEKLRLQVLEIHKRILGPEDPDMLTHMRGLAKTYSGQERWKEAEELELQALEISKKLSD